MRQERAGCEAVGRGWRLGYAGALLGLESARSNFGAASAYSTRFFDLVRDVATRTSDSSLQGTLQELLTSRDKITSGLAKQDPEVLSEIQILVAKVHAGAAR